MWELFSINAKKTIACVDYSYSNKHKNSSFLRDALDARNTLVHSRYLNKKRVCEKKKVPVACCHISVLYNLI